MAENKNLIALSKDYYDRYINSTQCVDDGAGTSTSKLPKRNLFYFCKQHNETQTWKTEHEECNDCFRLPAMVQISGGLLPLGNDVLAHLLTIKSSDDGKHVNAAYVCANNIVLHWLHCVMSTLYQ